MNIRRGREGRKGKCVGTSGVREGVDDEGLASGRYSGSPCPGRAIGPERNSKELFYYVD